MVNGLGIFNNFGRRIKDTLGITIIEFVAGNVIIVAFGTGNLAWILPVSIAYFALTQIEHVVSSRIKVS